MKPGANISSTNRTPSAIFVCANDRRVKAEGVSL
jgi:hypothetical protein